jgi:hypothetical protein
VGKNGQDGTKSAADCAGGAAGRDEQLVQAALEAAEAAIDDWWCNDAVRTRSQWIKALRAISPQAIIASVLPQEQVVLSTLQVCPSCGAGLGQVAAVSPDAEIERLRALVKDDAETDIAVRNIARPVLGDAAVDGDSYGVPTLEDIVERLRASLASHESALIAEQELAEQQQARIAELEALLRDGRDCANELAFNNTRRWDTKNRVALIQRIDAAVGRKD